MSRWAGGAGGQVQVVRRHIQALARRADSAGGGVEEQEVEQPGAGQVLYYVLIIGVGQVLCNLYILGVCL